jgi:CheY-like chemotaxis protein
MAPLATPTEASLIRRCVELQPALVLLDVYLAGEPVGISLARALKSNSKTADIKVILWSAAPLPANFAADDFFNKSDDLAVLVDKIKLHLPAQFYSEA